MIKRKISPAREKSATGEKNKKTATVTGITVQFTVVLAMFIIVSSIWFSNVAVVITGFTEVHMIPRGILWTLDILGYLIALYVATTLSFRAKAKKILPKGELPKVIRNISVVYISLVIFFTILEFAVSGLVIMDIVMMLVTLAIGLWFIRGVIPIFPKLPTLYIEVAFAVVIVLGVVLFQTSDRASVITTGRFGHGTEQYNELANQIFGQENPEERFNIYFNWFNVVHEIGHAIIRSNDGPDLNPVDEELLVNEFAVAFLAHHGEEGKLDVIEEIVDYARRQVVPPVENMTHEEYAREYWGRGDFFSFNNYGWFQFNVVYYALQDTRSLEEILVEMGVENIHVQPEIRFIYESFDENMVEQVIYDSVSTLRDWGAVIHPVYHRFSDNPATHNMLPTRNVLGILDQLHSLAIGD